jgi:hypothetical protein
MNRVVGFSMAVAMLLSAAAPADARDKSPSAADITALFPGSWERKVEAPSTSAKFEATVKKDGTYSFKGKIKSDKGENSVAEEGTWKVVGVTIVLTPKNPPADGPKTQTFSVLEINDKTLKWKSERKAEADAWTRSKE